MPWTPDDATRHDKKIKSKSAKHAWASIANNVLRETGDEGKAIRIANAKARSAGDKMYV